MIAIEENSNYNYLNNLQVLKLNIVNDLSYQNQEELSK